MLYAVSPAFVDDAQDLKELVPNAVTRVFGDAGHAFFVDQHEEFNRVLLEFLRGLA